MNLVADESVDQGIIELLVKEGFEVFSISKENPGISDLEVLNTATEANALLLTEDKDFGELTIRLRQPNRGIILIRANHLSVNTRAALVLKTLETFRDELKEYLTVIDDEDLIRMRKFKI